MPAEKFDYQIPVLGDLPLLGALLRTGDAHLKGRSLLILVAPHMVKIND
jgi:Flp pilus assembly secretin CpaC